MQVSFCFQKQSVADLFTALEDWDTFSKGKMLTGQYDEENFSSHRKRPSGLLPPKTDSGLQPPSLSAVLRPSAVSTGLICDAFEASGDGRRCASACAARGAVVKKTRCL